VPARLQPSTIEEDLNAHDGIPGVVQPFPPFVVGGGFLVLTSLSACATLTPGRAIRAEAPEADGA
jgi:hypothetical protein